MSSLGAAFQCKTDTDCLHDDKGTKCSEYFSASCECAAGYVGANCGKWRTSLSTSVIQGDFSISNDGLICM